MEKSCSNCAETVQYSIVVIVSSVGVSPRIQKSSTAVLFCDQCLRELSERLCSDELQKSVNSVYTELNQRLRRVLDSSKKHF